MSVCKQVDECRKELLMLSGSDEELVVSQESESFVEMVSRLFDN